MLKRLIERPIAVTMIIIIVVLLGLVSVYMLPHFINNNMRNLNYQRLAVASVVTLCAIAVITAVVYAFEIKWEARV